MHKILVVSDDVFMRDVIRLSLLDMKAEIRCSAYDEQMEQICHQMLFDLVIVLSTSPFWSGRDVVRDLRPSGLQRPLFYVISWQQAEQTVLSLLESGVDQYMTFPVSLQRLRNKVANELSRRL